MATTLNNYIANTAATITLASLASSATAGRATTAIDNTSVKAISADVRVKLKTAASGASAAGYASVYIIRSDDGTNYDDSFGGSDAAHTPVNATLLGTMSVVANSTTYQKVFDTAELGLTLPQKYAICVVNTSGAALSGTAGDHSVTIETKSFSLS